MSGLKQSENMDKLRLPYVNLPHEFLTLLKSHIPVTTAPSLILDHLKANRSLTAILEAAFQEFTGKHGLDQALMGLGWANFRDRIASIYVYKVIYGNFPTKTDMGLVEDIKQIESQFSEHALHSYSRLFLLGFYLKLANVDLKIPIEVKSLLKLTQGRSQRIDWLILILMHLLEGLGEKTVATGIAAGKKLDELYPLMSSSARESMLNNLLAYGASIEEADVFLYERI